MKQCKDEFINELGNSVTVYSEEVEVSGVPGILLGMKGPTSEVENLITLEEARVLRKQLNTLLGE